MTTNQKRKISKLANASLICVIAEYGLITLAILLYKDWVYCGEAVRMIIPILTLLLIVATPILGIVSLIEIIMSKGLLSGKLRAAIAIILSMLIIMLFLIQYWLVIATMGTRYQPLLN